MNRNILSKSLISSVFVAGLIAAGAVSAQPATQQPLPAGDTATGLTKETQRPDGTAPVSREAVKAETRAAVRTPGAALPAGDSKTVGGMKAQQTPRGTSGMSRAEVSSEAKSTPMAGARGEQRPRQSSPTNQKNNSGAPN
jgi:hypothetical protein